VYRESVSEKGLNRTIKEKNIVYLAREGVLAQLEPRLHIRCAQYIY